ncbi:HET-domain-containing protein, partial [Zopfia rhizophila CBS 207.26]
QIRLLTIHPSDEDTSPLSYSLDYKSLFKAPPFAALLYCWGKLKDEVNITVNSLTVPVTANLYSALMRLRAEGLKCVWVDALCINQQDKDEKSYQVKRMGAIFQKAD